MPLMLHMCVHGRVGNCHEHYRAIGDDYSVNEQEDSYMLILQLFYVVLKHLLYYIMNSLYS